MPDTERARTEELNEDKLVATVLYLLRGCAPARPGVTSLLKMLWYADYEHYRQHLSTITGATYVALPNGPVLDNYKEILNELEASGLIERNQVEVPGCEYPKEEHLAIAEPDIGVLSNSDREILDTVIERHGDSGGRTLIERTHREGPWQLIYDAAEPGRPIPRIAYRWLDNLPDEEDLERAHDALSREDVREHVARLNEAAATQWR